MFRLGTRKLQKINTGYYISTPSEWVAHHGLTKHALVRIFVDDDGCLILDPKQV